MNDFILYDETEQTSTRYIGYAGDNARLDIAITTTAHFYGKKLVTVIQSGRTAILGENDVEDVAYVQETFRLSSEDEARELAEFLTTNL